MQNNKSVLVVRIIAIVTAAIALYSLAGLLKVIWLESSYTPQSDSMSKIFVLNLVWYIWFALLLVLKIVSAYGLFRIRPWSWKFAIAVFSADFLSRLYGIMSMLGEAPTLNQSEGGIIGSFNIWPIYIQAIIPLIVVIILLQKPIKKLFSKNERI
ncbi:hypothetical protein [Marinicella gelatinilytica]|uniref:hypothetical protein n=1 Tax=Marinicella gelatinilytica TaxID=2996017 RepID=UPI002260CC66|nr:hypothetical protein [Marinicella gelatinilytica]MCX7544723.1 hypothetical protein [Marinicella gelatinilytica]